MSSADLTEHLNRHLIEIKPNIDNIRLIYLNTCEPTFDIQSNLLKINPATLIYTDVQLCIDLIKTIYDERIFLIISSVLLSNIFDTIHSLRSIIAIFIYDDKQPYHEFKIKYPKAIYNYTNQNELLKSIKEKVRFINKQTFVYSIFDSRKKLIKYLTKESALCLWHHMLIKILKQMPCNEFERDDLLSKSMEYYRTNRHELDNIELFRQTYTNEQALQWYINKCFLYKLLNHALNTKNFEILYSMNFFLTDLCTAIEKYYLNMKGETYLVVYRAQLMSREEIERLKECINCLISINNFLLTTRNKQTSLSILQQNFSTLENALFEIHVDLSLETIILTDISSFSSLSCEKDILFNINSLFNIDSIEYDTVNNLWQIKMTASNDRIKYIDEYLKWIQNEMNYHRSMIYFGHLLWSELSEIVQAKFYFQILMRSLSNNDIQTANIYIELGNINKESKEYNLALDNYQHALEIYKQQTPIDYTHIAVCFNNIGTVYKNMKNFDRAMEYYQQSMDIFDNRTLTKEEYLQQTHTTMNIGLLHKDRKDFDTALTYLIQAYDARSVIFSNDDSLLTDILYHMGDISYNKNDFNQALDYYEKALSIQEVIYPDSHLNKAKTLRCIGIIYQDKDDWQNALNYFDRTLKMHQSLLSNRNVNHIDIAMCHGDMGRIYEKTDHLDLALNSYDQQYQIEESFLPLNHPNLITHFDRIIEILKQKGRFEKVMELCQQQLITLKSILGSKYDHHTRVARILVLIASIYEDKNPQEAHQYYQQALDIFKHNKDEDIFQICLLTMINFYWKCRMFDHALLCQVQLLDIRRSQLSSNHHDIGYSLRDLARIYRVMNKSDEALKYFEQSLHILKMKLGSEHVDVKNIQKEIFELKDTIKSVSSNADDDYNYRRRSNAHKELSIVSGNNSNSRSNESNRHRRHRLSSDSTSVTCLIL